MQKITKEDFLDRIYALAMNSKSEFQRLSKLGDDNLENMFNIESAIHVGQSFLNNYRGYQFGKRANEEHYTFYLNEKGLPSFTTNEDYKLLEKEIELIENEEYDELIDENFHTAEDEQTNKIYG